MYQSALSGLSVVSTKMVLLVNLLSLPAQGRRVVGVAVCSLVGDRCNDETICRLTVIPAIFVWTFSRPRSSKEQEGMIDTAVVG